ncbi:Crp/Fnr family transcriptional regulator [Streptomyces sp. NPDC059982]|uniref:Crp/Fnr family transcriptional regulator n=1 Tax=unclassified Streptomyces TaxID=2593676 RepID=UPI0036D0BB84
MNFRELVPKQAWIDLINRGQRRIYRRDAVLLRQGESAASVIALVEGTVKILQTAETGDTITLTLRGPGEVLGEMGVILDLPRSATIRAVSGCVGYVLQAHAFRGYLDRHQLSLAVYQLAVERMQHVERMRADLARLAPAARLAHVLAHLAGEVGQPTDAGLLVELGMSREELAVMAGMGRSSAAPLLGQLQEAGILSLGRGQVVVKNLRRLEEMALGSANADDDGNL